MTMRNVLILSALIMLPACNESPHLTDSQIKDKNVDIDVSSAVPNPDADSSEAKSGRLPSNITEGTDLPSNITGTYLACEKVDSNQAENRLELGCQLADENGQLDLSGYSSANWTVSLPADYSEAIAPLTITDVRYHYQFAITSNEALDLPLLLPSVAIQAELKIDPNSDAVELFASNAADALKREMKQTEIGQVCFYEDPNFSRRELCFLGPIASSRFEETIWDNEVTSITIQGNLRVSLFSETDYLGDMLELTENVSFLGNFNFDDLTSSFKIESLD